jgi:hypothetical protein
MGKKAAGVDSPFGLSIYASKQISCSECLGILYGLSYKTLPKPFAYLLPSERPWFGKGQGGNNMPVL